MKVLISAFFYLSLVVSALSQALPFPGPGAALGVSCTTQSVNSTVLMHLDGANGATSTSDVYGHTVTASNVQLSTAQFKYGTASANLTAITANSGWIVGSGSADLQFGTGDFTIQYNYYATSADWTNSSASLSIGTDASGISFQQISGTSPFIRYYHVTASTLGTQSLNLNAWNWIVMRRSGTSLSTYVNGVRDINVSVASTSYTTAVGMTIGGTSTGGTSRASLASGSYVDEVSITKGTDLYGNPSTITQPTMPWCN